MGNTSAAATSADRTGSVPPQRITSSVNPASNHFAMSLTSVGKHLDATEI
jgi:hypothetical protein